MKQIELFDDLVPIQQYLHVWTEAERARRLNKKPADGARENPENRVEETGKEKGADEWIMPPLVP